MPELQFNIKSSGVPNECAFGEVAEFVVLKYIQIQLHSTVIEAKLCSFNLT